MIYTTSIFSGYLAPLVKKAKDGYSNCLEDIRDILCPLSFIEICNLDDVVTRTNEYVLRKVRIPNSDQSWSKSQGYRVILLCDITTEKVYFLCVYPKKGKLAMSDLTASGATLLIKQFNEAELNKEVFCQLCSSIKLL